MRSGFDLSNFTPVPTPADCAALLAAGFTFAIVGLQREPHAQQQVDALRAGGIMVEDCYIESTPDPSIPAGMLRGWIAVETGSNFEGEAGIDDQIAWCHTNGIEPGVYTSPYMIRLLGLAPLFEPGGKYADLPRWIADYDGDDTTLPAGAAMKQYSEHGQVPGLAYELDLDVEADVERELDQGERIALVNRYAAAISAGDTTHVYVDDADPNNLHIRIVTPK